VVSEFLQQSLLGDTDPASFDISFDFHT